MTISERLRRRVAEPALLSYFRRRGDPLARLLGNAGKDDPYPLYVRMREEPLWRSALGVWMTARHATASSVLRDRRFSSSSRGFKPGA